MKSTGVVRRIDELGRIVIPKEIRKTLRIKDGESIEIFTNSNEEIVLKKYSALKNLSDFALSLCDSIYSYLKHDIMITDSDSIIAISGKYRKEYKNKVISDSLSNYMKKRINIVEKHSKYLQITDSNGLECSYIIRNIISNSEVVGLIIIFSTTDKLGEVEEKVLEIVSQFLNNYLDE